MAGSLSLKPRNTFRQLLSQPAVVGSILVAVLVGSFLVAVIPRATERVAEEDLYATVSEPAAARRNIRVERQGRISAGPEDDPMAVIRGNGERFAETQMPPSVRSIVSDSYSMVTSTGFRVRPLPGEDPPHPFPTFLKYRYQEHIEDRLTLVDGSMPKPQEPVPILLGADCPEDPEARQELLDLLDAGGDPQVPEGEDFFCAITEVPHFQVAVTEQTAADMGLEIGQQMLLRPDPTDGLVFGFSSLDLDFELVMSISGIIELSDLSEEYWYGDGDLHTPRVQENADRRIIRATGLMNPAEYRSLMSEMGQLRWLHTWRYFVDPELVQEADIEELAADLNGFELEFSVASSRPDEFRVITLLSELIDEHLFQKQETLAMMTTSVAGLFSAVIAVVLVLAVLMSDRQRGGTVLLRGRGTSGGQLTLTTAYQGMALTVPAAVVGYFAALWAVPDTDYLLPYRATVALAAGTVAAIVVAALPLARRRLGPLLKGGGRPQAGTQTGRRVVFEVALVVLAFGAVALLRRRGQIESQPTSTEFDLLLAVAPTLVAVAVGLITVRLYPLLIRFLAWLGSKSRGLVGFVGFRRVIQHRSQALLPVLVILLCVAIATVAAISRATIAAGQNATSWQATGADYRVNSYARDVNLPSALDLDVLGEIEARAEARTYGEGVAILQFSESRAQVVAVETAAYSDVVLGTVADPNFPSALLESPTPNAGQPDRPIPALVSSVWPRDVQFGIGDVFVLDLGNLQPTMVVAGIRDRYPDTELDRPFVVFNLDSLRTFSDLPLPATVAYLRAPSTEGETIRSTLTGQSQSAEVTSRYETLDSIATDPFVGWVSTGLLVVFGFSVILAVVAAVSSLAMGSAERRRDFAYLRTMGLITRQATIMTVIEQFPAVMVATVMGAVAGVGTAVLLDPAVDFNSFTGNLVETVLEINWMAIVAGALLLASALAAAVVIFVAASREDELGRTLRVGDE